MNKHKKSRLPVVILCWVLIAMMLLGAATYFIYMLLGLM